MKIDIDVLYADRQKLVLFAIIFCAVVYVDSAFLIRAQMKSVAAVQQKETKLKAELDGITRDMALMRQKSEETKKAVVLRGEGAMTDLLKDISQVASGHNIKLLQITPLKSKEARKLQSQSYLALTVKLDMVGGYHDFGSFLNDLEHAAHPLFAQGFRITQGDDPLKQRISLDLMTYVRK
ncbi:MAG: type 4a pilus biogenesis protein PilO [Deltaproteobacteria bacterium]